MEDQTLISECLLFFLSAVTAAEDLLAPPHDTSTDLTEVMEQIDLVTSDLILHSFFSFSCFPLTDNAGKFMLAKMKHLQSYRQKSQHEIIWHTFLFFFTFTESPRIEWLMSVIVLTVKGKLSKLLKRSLKDLFICMIHMKDADIWDINGPKWFIQRVKGTSLFQTYQSIL